MDDILTAAQTPPAQPVPEPMMPTPPEPLKEDAPVSSTPPPADEKPKKKKFSPGLVIAGIFLLLVTLPLIFFSVKQQQEVRSRAAGVTCTSPKTLCVCKAGSACISTNCDDYCGGKQNNITNSGGGSSGGGSSGGGTASSGAGSAGGVCGDCYKNRTSQAINQCLTDNHCSEPTANTPAPTSDCRTNGCPSPSTQTCAASGSPGNITYMCVSATSACQNAGTKPKCSNNCPPICNPGARNVGPSYSCPDSCGSSTNIGKPCTPPFRGGGPEAGAHGNECGDGVCSDAGVCVAITPTDSGGAVPGEDGGKTKPACLACTSGKCTQIGTDQCDNTKNTCPSAGATCDNGGGGGGGGGGGCQTDADCNNGRHCQNNNCIGGGGNGGGGGGGGGGTAQCVGQIKAYKGTDELSAADLKTLKPGDTVTLTLKSPVATTKARFKVNSGAYMETTTKNDKGEYVVDWTVPNDGTTSFTVSAQIFVKNAWRG